MNCDDLQDYSEELKKHLYCVGTVYDSFEALLEVMGRLKLEQPLYLIYLAQKLFAQEVFNAAREQNNTQNFYYEPIEIKKHSHQNNLN